jgi:hypothetical protein
MICHGIAAPPRKAGSSEGWKQSEPSGGASTISGGRITVV